MNSNSITTILLVVILGLGGYTFYQNWQFKKLRQKQFKEDIEYVEELTPIIKNQEEELIITNDRLIDQKKNIQVLQDSMNNIGIDTLSIDEAIKIIKIRAKDYENTEHFDSVGIISNRFDN